MREKILELLSGKKIESQPAFSGLIHVTAEGLESEGLIFHESPQRCGEDGKGGGEYFQLTGMPSATLPLDLCAPAEALGSELIFYEGEEFQFPQVKKLLFESTSQMARPAPHWWRCRPASAGRIPLICKAIELVKNDIGKEAVISGLIPGPYTLLIYVCKVQNLFREMKKEPATVANALLYLSDFLADIGNAYLEAGADFITVHEMGGSPGFIGPAKFEEFVLAPLKALHGKLNGPKVLSVCGNTNSSMQVLAQCGADAISVDQVNDLAASRAVLKDVLLFGNIDPVETLSQGGDAEVTEAVVRAKEAGVDAVWPGCDLVIQTPIKNINLMTGRQ
jgi:[methyl-Co(III) methanol-specific corrinoid protein]:coenzyme M methyltransferase